MGTIFVDQTTKGIRYIRASNGESEYLLWQLEPSKTERVYFEYDDQIRGGYDIVTECTLDMDGCHIVLESGELVHFYWSPPRHQDLPKFVTALKSVYASSPGILQVDDY